MLFRRESGGEAWMPRESEIVVVLLTRPAGLVRAQDADVRDRPYAADAGDDEAGRGGLRLWRKGVMSDAAMTTRRASASSGSGSTGATFEDVHLDGARLHDVDLRGASLRMVDLRGLRARDVWLEDVDITGEVENVRINGVDIAPLVEAELDRRDPDRPKMRPTDAAGYREAWDIVERLWARHRRAGPHASARPLHERVDGEWSFIETLRHLVFATDAWVRRALLGDPEPWDALDLPHDDMPDSPPVPRDRDGATVARRGPRPARRPHGDRAPRRRRPHRRGARRRDTVPSRARLSGARAYAVTGSCAPSSTRSGSTGSTPSATSTPSRPAPAAGSSGALTSPHGAERSQQAPGRFPIRGTYAGPSPCVRRCRQR